MSKVAIFEGDVDVNGTFRPSTMSFATGSITNTALSSSLELPRSKLAQETLETYPIPLTNMRVHDAIGTILPAAAADDDMGLISGAFGTAVPTLQGVDFGGAATDEKCRFQFALPPEYDDGQTITLRLRCAMLTTLADTASTVDAEVYKSDRDGAVGADLCATAAQSINSLTPANIDFTITPTGLAAGDLLDIQLAFIGSDAGNLGVMIPEISQVEMLLDIRG